MNEIKTAVDEVTMELCRLRRYWHNPQVFWKLQLRIRESFKESVLTANLSPRVLLLVTVL